MNQEDFALIALLLCASCLFGAWKMWRGKDAREDVGLMAGAGAGLAALAATLHLA